MVTLVVATTTDPASYGPATALLAMPGWQPGPTFQVPSPTLFYIYTRVLMFIMHVFIVTCCVCDEDWCFCLIVRV